jgi:hypothetical protein
VVVAVLIDMLMINRQPEDPEPPDPPRKALLALLFVAVLVVGGLLLTQVLRHMSQLQDCVMSGRTNCAPIDSSTSGRP